MNIKNSENLMSSSQNNEHSNFFQKPGEFSIKCPTHPRFELTNICMAQGCIEPLCPECFKYHLKLHTDIQSPCYSETLITMRETCQENVQSLLHELVKEKQRLTSWQDDRSLPQEESLLRIRQAKETLMIMIHKFFESIEKNINENMLSFKNLHQEEFDQLCNKINLWIEDLQNMQIELNSSEYIKCMLKMLMQGFSADLETLKKDVSNCFDNWEAQSPNYFIDEGKLNTINMELTKYIRLQDNNPLQRNKFIYNEASNSLKLPTKEYNKENQEIPVMYKNLRNYIQSLKSPDKSKKLLKTKRELEKTAPQKENSVRDLFQETKLDSKPIPLEMSLQNQCLFEAPNYFYEETKHKFLCFFQDNSKKFHYLDLVSLEKQNTKYPFQEKELPIDFKIPLYHRSLITPKGEIFLIGGIDPQIKTQATNKVYQLEINLIHDDFRLITKCPLNYARYSHSLCFANKYVFAVGGGFDINESYLNTCEKYDIEYGDWTPLSPCHKATIGSGLCNFNDQFLYKFGGKIDNSGFCNYIERFDIEKNFWSLFNIVSEDQKFKLANFANTYQINKDEILVFGGSINETLCRKCLLMKIPENNEENSWEEKIIEIKMEINSPGSFWVPSILHENVLFNIQNVVMEPGKEICHFGKKRKLICNSEIWKEI